MQHRTQHTTHTNQQTLAIQLKTVGTALAPLPLPAEVEPEPVPHPLPAPVPPPPPPCGPGGPTAPAPPADPEEDGDEGHDGHDAATALAREALHLARALRSARQLTLAALRLTNGRGGAPRVAAELRRHAAGTALGLECGTPLALLQALRSLWRVSDLVDRAEREDLLSLDEAMELLTLGSRVEVPLVAVLRPCGWSLASG